MITVKWGRGRLTLVQGDITQVTADALVTAANNGLRGGGGVDGAIHRAGGPEILAACHTLGGCPTGQAVATTAGNLPAKWVIHAVGPIWTGGASGEAGLLAAAYRASLAELCTLAGQSIAFPSISTGVYGYPLAEAAFIAVSTLLSGIKQSATPLEVTLVLFDIQTYSAYERATKILSDTLAE